MLVHIRIASTITRCTRSASSRKTWRTTAPSVTSTAVLRTAIASLGSRRRRPRGRLSSPCGISSKLSLSWRRRRSTRQSRISMQGKPNRWDDCFDNLTTFQTQAPVAVPSAASFPDGAAAPAAKTTAMDDLLGLESEISAIQVVLQLLINEQNRYIHINMN